MNGPVEFSEKYRWPKWSYEGAEVIVPFLIPDKPIHALYCKVTIATGDLLLVENKEHGIKCWRNLHEGLFL